MLWPARELYGFKIFGNRKMFVVFMYINGLFMRMLCDQYYSLFLFFTIGINTTEIRRLEIRTSTTINRHVDFKILWHLTRGRVNSEG